MRIRPLFALLLVALLALAFAPGCGVYQWFVKTTGIVSPPELDTSGELPPDFRCSVAARDMADPPVDYTFEFDRTGRAKYEVTVRVPRRSQSVGEFEITEDKVVGIWKALQLGLWQSRLQ